MRIFLTPRQKGVPPPWVFVGTGLLLCLGIVKAATLLPLKLLPPCGFHVATGHPCPTCGCTRVLLHAVDGNLRQAFRANPLFLAILALLGLWVLAGALAGLSGRDLKVEAGRFEKYCFWGLAGAAFFANWAYLWVAGI